MTLHLGVQLSPSNATWDEVREAGLLVDDLGYDSLWVSDHLRSSGRADAPYFEAWQTIAALGALTKRARVGVLVSPVNLRHPAVIAKMVAALDHITAGRAVVGLGAGWFESEHVDYGIRFGTKRERGQRLREAAAIVRSLLDQRLTTFTGKHYRLENALAEPKPLQRRLPIMIGGTGDRTVLPAVARHADMWNAHGPPDYLERKLRLLREQCARAGRDPAEIAVSVALRPVIVRDDSAEINARYQEIGARNRLGRRDARFAAAGDVDAVARRLAEFWSVGARGFIFQAAAPYDGLTIRRLIGEVRPCLEELVGA